jgi:hypothetical protein
MLSLARILIILGALLLGGGMLLYLAARTGLQLGQMPGNIKIQGTNFTCVFALGASIVLSILLTVILNLVARFLNK